MNHIQIQGFLLNLIIYVIMVFPLIIICTNKKIFSTKKDFLSTLIYCTLLEIFLSAIVYIFPNRIFSLFTNTKGVINYAIYSSRILFISSSLYSLKILIPAYLVNQKKAKKITILVLTKIVITATNAILFYILFNTKGILFAFPICDFIFYIIYILNIIR